jgi:signal transduction histidine kinase
MAFASILLGRLMAGRVLRPLGDMTATVRRITADRLDRRLAASGPDDELKELADTFDELLDRLEAAFTAQRRFVANASHELRTPLTLQQAMAEVALADPEADAGSLRAVLERLLAAGKHQERLIEALLTLARSQQGLDHRQPLDLAAITGQALGQPGNPGVRIESALHPAPASGDRALIERLVANLLDNAVRHNVPGGWIKVATAMRSGRPTLRIANSGPVIPPGRVHTLLQPFQRLETGRKATGDSLGLGLSIVAAIVKAHHGTLEARPLPGGGLEVTVALDPSGRTADPYGGADRHQGDRHGDDVEREAERHLAGDFDHDADRFGPGQGRAAVAPPGGDLGGDPGAAPDEGVVQERARGGDQGEGGAARHGVEGLA